MNMSPYNPCLKILKLVLNNKNYKNKPLTEILFIFLQITQNYSIEHHSPFQLPQKSTQTTD